MNILIFSWRGLKHPHAGGAEIVTHEHAKAWVKKGHQVDLFTSSFPGAIEKEEIDDVGIIRRGNQAWGVQIAAFFWYVFGKDKDYDLVIDHFHGIPFFTPFYVRAKKLAFIHEVAKEVWMLNPWPRPFNLIPAMIGPTFEPFIFKLYKKIPFMTVSQSTKQDLEDYGIHPKMIHVIHNGVKVLTVENKYTKENKRTAIYLGALSEDKGIKDAIRVFAEIDRKTEDWQYWVVGKGSEEYIQEIHNLINELGISKKVKPWGYVSEKKKFELLAKAHIMINPSIREGWGLVNIEANSERTPVIAYNVPGNRDSILDKKTGILVENRKYRDMAIEAVKLLNNMKVYGKMQDEAFKWSKKFVWDQSTKKSTELIESL